MLSFSSFFDAAFIIRFDVLGYRGYRTTAKLYIISFACMRKNTCFWFGVFCISQEIIEDKTSVCTGLFCNFITHFQNTYSIETKTIFAPRTH